MNEKTYRLKKKKQDWGRGIFVYFNSNIQMDLKKLFSKTFIISVCESLLGICSDFFFCKKRIHHARKKDALILIFLGHKYVVY